MQFPAFFKQPDRLFSDPDYKGIPIQPAQGPFMESYLERTLRTIDGAMSDSQMLYMSCVTLSAVSSNGFPFTFNPHAPIEAFIRAMIGWTKNCQSNNTYLHKRNARIDYVWQMSRNEHGIPVFRIMLLLNPEAYLNLGDKPERQNLIYRVHRCWRQALSCPLDTAIKSTKFNTLLDYVGNGADDLIQVFQRATVLCKAPLHDQGRGTHGFGSSRS